MNNEYKYEMDMISRYKISIKYHKDRIKQLKNKLKSIDRAITFLTNEEKKWIKYDNDLWSAISSFSTERIKINSEISTYKQIIIDETNYMKVFYFIIESKENKKRIFNVS
jgi:predicted  nucleic acid-binding Zn-ribbon protein